MKLSKIHEITFEANETNDSVMAVSLHNANELLALMRFGQVIRYHINEKSSKALFSVKSNIGYPDGGFDVNEKSSFYTLGEIVVIVNDYKRHGFIHYPEKYDALHLWREDYLGDISCYPIALFKNQENVPHIIYAAAWNHVQIMNLDTRQILTAAKSLIEENAEQNHIEYYKKHEEHNKRPWPNPYDYFFGKLLPSPDQKTFLSMGWAWGSCDYYNAYDIENFISNNRISEIHVSAGEHENRAACWVNNQTIAVAYHPFIEGDEGATAASPCEIHFYKIKSGHAKLDKKVQIIDQNIVSFKLHYEPMRFSEAMYFSAPMHALIIFSEAFGLSIISLEGDIIFHDASLKIHEYHAETNTLLSIEKLSDESQKVTIYAIENK